MDVRILGPLEVLVDGVNLHIGPPRQRAVLARLLMNPGEATSIDRLIEDLWPGDVPDSARHALHVYLSNLRSALGPNRDRLVRRESGYLISLERDELDAVCFARCVNDGRDALSRGDAEAARSVLTKALALWRGPVLADIATETFVYAEAARLEELRLVALELRITADLELGRHDALIEELRDLVEAHPFRENLWGQLLLTLYRSGRQAEALEAFQDARSRLVEDLGLEPGPALRRLEEQILHQDPNLDLSRARSGATAARLPRPRTSFIGRERELELGGELLRNARLLTLTGPPGSGKTRLAIQLAAQHSEDFDDGPFFVPLAAINNVSLVDATIAKALGLRDVAGEKPLDGLKGYLRSRRALVVLDNFEQVIGAAPMVVELLEAAQETTIMVTSRAPLGVSGEQQFPIAPLAVPPLDESLTPAEVEAYDAAELFAARARTSEPSFTVDEGTAADIAAITAHLDGLPLAIELAAAQMKLLSPHDLVARLRERRPALSEGPTDVDHRHRTLRDAIAGSYDALEPGEQALFRRLGVFRGFTLESASAVTGLSDESVFVGVDRLLSQSLIYRVDGGASARYAMLETLRDFALGQLDTAGEWKETATNQAGWYRRLAEDAELPLTRELANETVALLSVELDNIRNALGHCVDTGDVDTGLFLAGSIWRFFQSAGRLVEGCQWFETLLALPGASNAARARGLTGLASLEYWQGDDSRATAHYEEALGCYRELGDRFNEADTLFSMSMSIRYDFERCERLANEALAMFEELGSREKSGQVYMAIAALMHRQGRHDEARPLWERALSIAYELGDRQLAVTQEIGIGICEYHAGDLDQALRIALTCLNKAENLDNVQLAIWMLEYIAAFSASINPREAACLAGAVDALQREAGGVIPLDSLGISDARGVASESLGPDRYLAAASKGRALTLEQAIEYARGLNRPPSEST